MKKQRVMIETSLAAIYLYLLEQYAGNCVKAG